MLFIGYDSLIVGGLLFSLLTLKLYIFSYYVTRVWDCGNEYVRIVMCMSFHACA